MKISVAEAASRLEARGCLVRYPAKYSENLIASARKYLGRDLPHDLEEFYRERIHRIGEFTLAELSDFEKLMDAQAAPVLDDGCGSLFGLDLAAGDATPAVYFFDHEDEFSRPLWAAGSSLGSFMLLAADHDKAYAEDWPERWQLSIDPDIDKCPRAPAIWNTSY